MANISPELHDAHKAFSFVDAKESRERHNVSTLTPAPLPHRPSTTLNGEASVVSDLSHKRHQLEVLARRERRKVVDLYSPVSHAKHMIDPAGNSFNTPRVEAIEPPEDSPNKPRAHDLLDLYLQGRGDDYDFLHKPVDVAAEAMRMVGVVPHQSALTPKPVSLEVIAGDAPLLKESHSIDWPKTVLTRLIGGAYNDEVPVTGSVPPELNEGEQGRVLVFPNWPATGLPLNDGPTAA